MEPYCGNSGLGAGFTGQYSLFSVSSLFLSSSFRFPHSRNPFWPRITTVGSLSAVFTVLWAGVTIGPVYSSSRFSFCHSQAPFRYSWSLLHRSNWATLQYEVLPTIGAESTRPQFLPRALNLLALSWIFVPKIQESAARCSLIRCLC